ncbi:glycosyltransferase family 4 protein [Tunicatimonas pelagia]|uniref:glycosyltransferase family 4 protein n=1 Tax=Tunicatimonas pelagia TaxID=931531 RepID=UPI0026670098|nr:glycosyltransferase family 4 protein [Tunicatimonas pelagia]WKN44440.1 glycosyltransferase family 4 protein [Tunicatimonas pelagia]
MVSQLKPTVLIVENSIDTTGAFNSIFNYACYAQTEYRFLFILPQKSQLVNRVSQAGFAVETLPFREISKKPINLLLYFPTLLINAFRLNKLVREHKADIVHMNDFYNLVGVMAKAAGGKFVLLTHVRFMPNRFPALLVKFWMKLNLVSSEYIICVSEAVKNCLFSHAKLQVIYDCLSSFPSPPPRSERKENDVIRLLHLAHYIPGKGQDIALNAFAKAYRKNSKLRLRFVGGDMGLDKNKQYIERLKQHAQALEIYPVVEFGEATSNVAEELKKADIFLNFSESESFSMTCLEALASGVPLIATNSGGPAELFEDGESGYLIPNRDAEAGAKAMLLLAEDERIRKRFSQSSISYVRCKFSAENTVRKLANLYAKVVTC